MESTKPEKIEHGFNPKKVLKVREKNATKLETELKNLCGNKCSEKVVLP